MVVAVYSDIPQGWGNGLLGLMFGFAKTASMPYSNTSKPHSIYKIPSANHCVMLSEWSP